MREFLLLYFTSDRLIVAETGRTSWRLVTLLWGLLTPVGAGIYSVLAERKARRFAEELETLAADKVLATSSSNYAIGYDEMDSIELRGAGFLRLRTIEVAAAGAHHRFGTADIEGFDLACEVLPGILGEKIRVV